MILVFWMLSFKPTFLLSSFTFIHVLYYTIIDSLVTLRGTVVTNWERLRPGLFCQSPSMGLPSPPDRQIFLFSPGPRGEVGVTCDPGREEGSRKGSLGEVFYARSSGKKSKPKLTLPFTAVADSVWEETLDETGIRNLSGLYLFLLPVSKHLKGLCV